MSEDKIQEELAADGSLAGVESENTTAKHDPFDPDSISIDPKVVPMETLLRRLKQGSIRLAPAFQRQFVWDAERSSQLIESLMLKIPLPMFYVSANEDGSWDVVDGLQRLTTIRNFLLGDERDKQGKKIFPDAKLFRLEKLEFWGSVFNGLLFKDIENDPKHAKIVNNILESEFRFTAINPGTPEEVKRNIFKRINTGGMPLTPQEIRHALYQGVASELLAELAKETCFTTAIDNSVDDSRMAARELILRFLAFSIRRESDYSGDMDKFLSDTMRLINLSIEKRTETELKKIFRTGEIPTIRWLACDELTKRFESAMTRCMQFFGEYAFRKAVSGRRTPINKALFDTWANIFADLSDEHFALLFDNKECFLQKYQALLNDHDWFERVTSRDASSSWAVRERYEKLRKVVQNVLEGKC